MIQMKKFIKILPLILIVGITLTSLSARDHDYGFASARRPMSNPVHFDLPLPITHLHPIVIYQTLPSSIDTTAGPLPVNGDLQVYALAFEYAINNCFSIVAAKDGYIDFNPKKTFSKKEGFADVCAGLKYLFYYDCECNMAASAKILVNLPLGNQKVFQGGGDGTIIPSLTGLQIMGCWQFVVTGGFILPFNDGKNSTQFFHSWHVSYELCSNFFPFAEFNHIHTFDSGNGASRFPEQAGGATPAIAKFEGGDLINFGASHAKCQRDFNSLAFGARYRFMDCLDIGAAFEFPLSPKTHGLMETRTTVDAIIRF